MSQPLVEENHRTRDFARQARTSRSEAGARRRRRAVIVMGAAAVTALVMIQVAVNLVDYGVYNYRFALVNPNRESNLFAWISATAIAVAACLCLLLSRRSESQRPQYLALGILLAFFAIENRVRLHEEAVHDPLGFVPLFGAIAAGLIWISWYWPKAARSAVWAGIATLALSVALHRLAPHLLAHYGYAADSWPYEVKVSLKESGELSGWGLIATALATAAMTEGRPRVRGLQNEWAQQG